MGDELKPVVSGASFHKKSLGEKLLKVFVPEDIGDVFEHILTDVIVPTVKTAIVDIGRDAIERIVWGDEAPRTARRYSQGGGMTAKYSGMYRGSSNSTSNAQKLAYEDLEFEYREQAEDLLSSVDDLIARSGFASVKNFYTLAGKSSAYTCADYVWRDTRAARIERYRNKWILRMPEPEYYKT